MAKPSKLALIGFLLVCLCFGARIGYAQTFSDTFEKLYAEMKDAMSRRDTNAVAALLAPGFVSEDISGKVQSAEQMLVELSGLPQDANKKSQTTLLSVDIRGNIANDDPAVSHEHNEGHSGR